MLKLSHKRQTRPDLMGWERDRSPGDANKDDLLWYYFPGHIELRTDDATLVSQADSVPALHFVAGMLQAVNALAETEFSTYTYYFTEADQSVNVERMESSVVIEGSFSSQKLTVTFQEFEAAVRSLVQQVIADLGDQYPELLKTSIVRDLRSEKW